MSVTRVQLIGNVSAGATFVGVVTAPSVSVGSAVTINSSGINISSGVVTATTFFGTAITATVAGYATTAGIATVAGYATTAGIATVAQGLTGTPNLNVGIVTVTTLGINTTSTSQTFQVGSGSTVVVIDSAGDLGIGTGTVPTKLYVQGNAASNIISVGNTNANTTLDLSRGNNFSLTLTGNIVLQNPTNFTVGQSGIILIQQDGNGNRTIGLGTFWDFPSATLPTFSTVANSLDCLTYFVRTSTSIVTNSLIGIGTL